MASLCHLYAPCTYFSPDAVGKANSAFANGLLLEDFSHKVELIKQLLAGQSGTSLCHIQLIL